MAISTYAELQATIATWLHRTDLTAIIPDFIALAESRINRNLLANERETDTPLTGTIGSRYIALPAGFVSPEALWLTYYAPVRDTLVYLLAETMPVTTTNSQPLYWTIDGTNIAFDCPCDLAYTFTLRSRQALALSTAATTNWLLTNHPDVYLYAALMESAPYIKDDQRIMTWKGAYDMAIQEVNDKEGRAASMATLGTDTMGRSHIHSNIIGG